MTAPAIIDAHIHFWDPGARHHAWLAGDPLLCRRFGPADVPTGHHDVARFVFVQADCRDDEALDEVAWVSALAETDSRIGAIVAHAALERGAPVREHLERLAANPRVAGVRRLLQDEPDELMVAPPFVAGVRLLKEFDFTFDICVRHGQLRAVAELVAACPEVTFVLDHLGKPPVAAGALDPWRADLAALAALPNIVCKLSGLTTEAGQRWRAADLKPYLAHAIAVFGPGRCLVGSDWPVATRATSYVAWFDLVIEALLNTRMDELEGVLAGNAAAVYGLANPHDHDLEMERAGASRNLHW